MADQNNPHFKDLYWFCVLVVGLGFGYVIAVTFLTIPEKNQRTVDTVVGFCLGSMVMSGVGFLLGGNPTAAKKTDNISTDKMNVEADNVEVKNQQ